MRISVQAKIQFLFMSFLAVLTGILASLGALLFRAIVAFVHNLFFLGQINFIYNETLHTPQSPWGLGIILVPMIGGIIVIWLIEKFAHGERGLSVLEIMYKIYYQEGRISPIAGLAKTLASAISIGSGASIGREGPIIQMGAAISSLLSDLSNLSVDNRKILLAAGAAAGTAAIFNAPLAGIAFAVELLLISVNFLSVSLIIIATITATLINWLIFRTSLIFAIHTEYHFSGYFILMAQLSLFVLLGLATGIFSTLFIRGVYWLEDILNHIFKNPYLRHMCGMLIIGILLYVMMQTFGHYYLEGIGYATIRDCLDNLLTNPWLLLLLFIGKLLATCLSLGSGASGGIFSPSLFMGATLGASLGLICSHLFPSLGINPIVFSIAGMAAAVGSITGAIITAILLTFELTRNFEAIIPILISVTIAYWVRQIFCKQSIYTLKLHRRGVTVTSEV